MPSKAERIQQRQLAAQAEAKMAAHREFIEKLPGPDRHGRVIPLVAQLVNEVHEAAGMQAMVNQRSTRAILGPWPFYRGRLDA